MNTATASRTSPTRARCCGTRRRPLTGHGAHRPSSRPSSSSTCSRATATAPRRRSGCIPGTRRARTGRSTAHGGRRGRRRIPGRALHGLPGAEHPGRRDAQGVLARAVRGQSASRARTPSSRAITRVLLKRAVKAVARRHGHGACFMAKPFADCAGCSLHVHMSLIDRRRAATSSRAERGRAVLGHAAARDRRACGRRCRNRWRSSRRPRTPIAAIASACSCRLTPNWGVNHRGVALRIPLSGPEDTRIEHRPGGADGNPYLVVAAMLAGIHHGLANRCDPGPMIKPGQVIDEVITLPTPLGCGARPFDAGTDAAEATSASSITDSTRRAAAKNASGITRRSAIATTSGICGRCSGAFDFARAQHTALYLAGGCLRQGIDELDHARVLVRRDRRLDELLQLAASAGSRRVRGSQRRMP